MAVWPLAHPAGARWSGNIQLSLALHVGQGRQDLALSRTATTNKLGEIRVWPAA